MVRSYQNYYETNFEDHTAWFEADIAAFMRAGYSKASPSQYGQPALLTANVSKDGGWGGCKDRPDPSWRNIPIEHLAIDEEMYGELVAAMEKTGFWAADAWYANHKGNRAYAFEKWKNDGFLHMPVLFIGAKWDTICATSTSR